MTLSYHAMRRLACALTLSGLLFTLAAEAQPLSTDDKPPADGKPAESYQTVYLANMTQPNDAIEIQNALRNMIPNARLYYSPSQGAMSIRANTDDMQLAQKVITDLDKAKKTYRLTYTMTEINDGKPAAERHYTLTGVVGMKTFLKQGTRVPLVTGSPTPAGTPPSTQVQYIDVGVNIEATLEGEADGVRLRTKVEQSDIADEKTGLGLQDPVIHQTTLDGTAMMAPGKPVVLGSADIPGSPRQLRVAVVADVVK